LVAPSRAAGPCRCMSGSSRSKLLRHESESFRCGRFACAICTSDWFHPSPTLEYEGVSQSRGSGSRSLPVRLPAPHSPLVGRVVNLEGARLLFRRVLDNLTAVRSPGQECLVAGVCFSSTNSVVSARSNILL